MWSKCWRLCCQIWNIALRPDGNRLSAWIRNFSEVVVRRQVEHWGLLGKGEEGKGEQQQDKEGHLCEHCSQDEKLGLSKLSWSSRMARPLCSKISLWVTRICYAHRGLNGFPPNPDSISKGFMMIFLSIKKFPIIPKSRCLKVHCDVHLEYVIASKLTWRKNYTCVPKKRIFRMLLGPQCTGSITIYRHPLCLEIDFLVVSY